MKRYKCKEAIPLKQHEKQLSILGRKRRKLVSDVSIAEKNGDDKFLYHCLRAIDKIDKRRMQLMKYSTSQFGAVYG